MTGYGIVAAFFMLLTSAGGGGKHLPASNYVDSFKAVSKDYHEIRDTAKALIIQVDKKDSL